jgi:hypothetical protein
MNADRPFDATRAGITPLPAPPEDVVVPDVETERQASLEWFESRLRSYTARIVRGLSVEQRQGCDEPGSVPELSPCS